MPGVSLRVLFIVAALAMLVQREFGDTMKLVKRLLTVVLLLAIVAGTVLFALSNPASVKVDFLAFQLTASAASWIIGAFVLGGLFGLLAGMGVLLRLKTTQVRTARKIKRFEQEISKYQAET